MKTISIVNLKGGVGKTITAVNLAAILASDYHKRVLLIDADHQGNATRFYRMETGCGTLADAFDGTINCYPELTLPTSVQGLDMIAANMSLASIDIDRGTKRSTLFRIIPDLRDAIIEDDAYDYIIIDCPPAFSVASISAIAASNQIVIPVKPGKFELDGMFELTDQIVSIRKANLDVGIAGVLLTMWHNSDVVLQGEKWLRKTCPVSVFRQAIRRTDKIDESTYAGKPICSWSPTSAASRDYRAWVQEFLGGELNGATEI